MRRTDPVRKDRHARTFPIAGTRRTESAQPTKRHPRELGLLTGQERGGRRVGDRGDAALEQALRGGQHLGLATRGAQCQLDGAAQLALVQAARAPVQVGVAEIVGLHVCDQSGYIQMVELDGGQPGTQQAAGVLGRDCAAAAGGALTRIALAQQPAHHRHHALGIRAGPGPGPVRMSGGQRARGEYDRGVGPLGGAALRPARGDAAGAHVRQELLWRAGRRRFGVCAPDVDPGVIVGAADPDAVARGDVRGGRTVQLGCAGAVADLPHPEQLGQTAAMARVQWSADDVVGMRERAGDVALIHVRGAQLHVVRVGLQPVVVVRRDVVAEHVHRHRGLAAEAGGQLLGDEHVGTVGDLHDAVDRVVVGDRDEVHTPALGQLIDLLGRRGALRQPRGALHAELGDLRSGRVAMHVHPADALLVRV